MWSFEQISSKQKLNKDLIKINTGITAKTQRVQFLLANNKANK